MVPGMIVFAVGLALGGYFAGALVAVAAAIVMTAVLATLASLLSFLVAWLFRSRRRGEVFTLVLVLAMSFLSLLPAVGSALVWAPAAAYLILTGAAVKGIALILVGVLVIGLIDNVLRPILVGRDTRLPDYVVLISTLGGISLFGINGFVIGPLIAALFMAAWTLFRDEQAEQRRVERTAQAAAKR